MCRKFISGEKFARKSYTTKRRRVKELLCFVEVLEEL
jgi:hypothetical protein